VEELDEIREHRRRQLAERLKARKEDDRMSSGTQVKPVDVTDADFKDFIKNNSVAVVDCWAPWCGPCQMVAPVIEGLAEELAGKVTFGKLNTDENPQTAMQFNIMSIPSLLFFSGGEHVNTLIGARPRESILQQLQPLLD